MSTFKDNPPEIGKRILVWHEHRWIGGYYRKDGDESSINYFVHVDNSYDSVDVPEFWAEMPANPEETT